MEQGIVSSGKSSPGIIPFPPERLGTFQASILVCPRDGLQLKDEISGFGDPLEWLGWGNASFLMLSALIGSALKLGLLLWTGINSAFIYLHQAQLLLSIPNNPKFDPSQEEAVRVGVRMVLVGGTEMKSRIVPLR